MNLGLKCPAFRYALRAVSREANGLTIDHAEPDVAVSAYLNASDERTFKHDHATPLITTDLNQSNAQTFTHAAPDARVTFRGASTEQVFTHAAYDSRVYFANHDVNDPENGGQDPGVIPQDPTPPTPEKGIISLGFNTTGLTVGPQCFVNRTGLSPSGLLEAGQTCYCFADSSLLGSGHFFGFFSTDPFAPRRASVSAARIAVSVSSGSLTASLGNDGTGVGLLPHPLGHTVRARTAIITAGPISAKRAFVGGAYVGPANTITGDMRVRMDGSVLDLPVPQFPAATDYGAWEDTTFAQAFQIAAFTSTRTDGPWAFLAYDYLSGRSASGYEAYWRATTPDADVRDHSLRYGFGMFPAIAPGGTFSISVYIGSTQVGVSDFSLDTVTGVEISAALNAMPGVASAGGITIDDFTVSRGFMQHSNSHRGIRYGTATDPDVLNNATAGGDLSFRIKFSQG